VEEAGLNPEEIVPHLKESAWNAYRHWWKTNRNGLGWTANKNAAYVGDWSLKTGDTADVVYARWSPHLVLACVEGKSIIEAIANDPTTGEYRLAAQANPNEE
jgi:hypothetical protein